MSNAEHESKLQLSTIASLGRAASEANLLFTAELLNAAHVAMRVELDLSNQRANVPRSTCKDGIFDGTSTARHPQVTRGL